MTKKNKKTKKAKVPASFHTKNVVNEANTGTQINGCARLIPIAVGLMYLLFFVIPNEIGYTYYLEKDNEPTTFSFYLQFCGALHGYDLIIAAIFMLFVCWFLWKQGILTMRGGEDPFQDKIATCLLTFFIYVFGVCLLPRAFYMTLFQVNHMSAEPVLREEVAIVEADTETPMYSHGKKYYYFVLDVDNGKRYKVYAKETAYDRYQKDSLRTVTVEWSKGILGYRFISRFGMPKTRRSDNQRTKRH